MSPHRPVETNSQESVLKGLGATLHPYVDTSREINIRLLFPKASFLLQCVALNDLWGFGSLRYAADLSSP